MNNGVIRIGRKGIKKFAFGEDGSPFEVDVVSAFQDWVCIDESFRERSDDGTIANADMVQYHQEAIAFVQRLASGGGSATPDITTAEALDFLARLRECYDELADFFRPKSRRAPDSPATSEVELQFSEEESLPTSTN